VSALVSFSIKAILFNPKCLFLNSNSTTSIHLLLGLPFYSFSLFTSNNFFLSISPTISTWSSHFNRRDLIAVTRCADLIFCINFLMHLYSPVNIFICWALYFIFSHTNTKYYMIQSGFNIRVELQKIIKERLYEAKPRILKNS
jgi:hypothetical protein